MPLASSLHLEVRQAKGPNINDQERETAQASQASPVALPVYSVKARARDTRRKGVGGRQEKVRAKFRAAACAVNKPMGVRDH